MCRFSIKFSGLTNHCDAAALTRPSGKRFHGGQARANSSHRGADGAFSPDRDQMAPSASHLLPRLRPSAARRRLWLSHGSGRPPSGQGDVGTCVQAPSLPPGTPPPALPAGELLQRPDPSADDGRGHPLPRPPPGPEVSRLGRLLHTRLLVPRPRPRSPPLGSWGVAVFLFGPNCRLPLWFSVSLVLRGARLGSARAGRVRSGPRGCMGQASAVAGAAPEGPE